MTPLQAITDFYGERRAERSQVPLINHIKEGLVILGEIGASEEAKDAFCLHPIFQSDADLANNIQRAREFPAYVMTLVMEYRLRANAALSDRVILVRDTPTWTGHLATPGALPEVRDMLIADKVQNYADFLLYHNGTHARSAELHYYFKHWLAQLHITPERFRNLVTTMKAE